MESTDKCEEVPTANADVVAPGQELIELMTEDLSNERDHSIQRSIIKQGEGIDMPNDEAAVDVHLMGICNGILFEDRDVNFQLGDGAKHGVVSGLEVALKHFRKGEISKIILASESAFGDNGKPEFNIPPQSEIEYEVELKSFENIKKSGIKKTLNFVEQAINKTLTNIGLGTYIQQKIGSESGIVPEADIVPEAAIVNEPAIVDEEILDETTQLVEEEFVIPSVNGKFITIKTMVKIPLIIPKESISTHVEFIEANAEGCVVDISLVTPGIKKDTIHYDMDFLQASSEEKITIIKIDALDLMTDEDQTDDSEFEDNDALLLTVTIPNVILPVTTTNAESAELFEKRIGDTGDADSLAEKDE